ncbi:MAG: carbohydrate binding family 9 domain-containing protein, partial [Acidobacteriota bacterium]|nr:carbohydrate binding family 9 domain-containing protein [Acidobacteriota bacterium]
MYSYEVYPSFTHPEVFIRILLRSLLAVLCGPILISAASPAGPGKVVLHPFLAPKPPILDGILDDAVWQQAPSVTDFETFIPEFGKRQREKTVAYLAYDKDNLYFAFRCFDPEPGKIKASVAKRDDMTRDDFVCINLDTYGDHQSLYAFYVNPFGIQGDSRFASGKEDFSVDLVWDSAGRVDAAGYSVEVRIPLKSIRYTQGDVVRMAVFLERFVSRHQEHGSYPALDATQGYAFLTQMAPLEYAGFARPTILELLPAFTFAQKRARREEQFVKLPDDRQWSLTGKYGITPSLILDATLNPDFSQIEADAGQIDANLRFGLFYAEKRPFFLEGSESYNVGATTSGPLQTIVHTRTIVDPRSGFKITGKLGVENTVAALFATDAPPPGPDAEPDAPKPVDARFTLLRYKRTTSGDGYLGAFLTSRDQGERSNQVLGPDGQIRLTPSGLLSFHAFGSRTRQGGGLERLDGHALGVEYLHDTSRLSISAAAHQVSDHFEADAGYLTRTGLTSASLSITPKVYPASTWLRRVDWNLTLAALKDLDSGLLEHDNAIGATGILQGNAALSLAIHDATEVFRGQRFRTDGFTFTARDQITKAFS